MSFYKDPQSTVSDIWWFSCVLSVSQMHLPKTPNQNECYDPKTAAVASRAVTTRSIARGRTRVRCCSSYVADDARTADSFEVIAKAEAAIAVAAIGDVADVFFLDHSRVRMKRVVAVNHDLSGNVRRPVSNGNRSALLLLVQIGIVPITDFEILAAVIVVVAVAFRREINELIGIDVLVVGMRVHAHEFAFHYGTQISRVHEPIAGAINLFVDTAGIVVSIEFCSTGTTRCGKNIAIHRLQVIRTIVVASNPPSRWIRRAWNGGCCVVHRCVLVFVAAAVLRFYAIQDQDVATPECFESRGTAHGVATHHEIGAASRRNRYLAATRVDHRSPGVIRKVDPVLCQQIKLAVRTAVVVVVAILSLVGHPEVQGQVLPARVQKPPAFPFSHRNRSNGLVLSVYGDKPLPDRVPALDSRKVLPEEQVAGVPCRLERFRDVPVLKHHDTLGGIPNLCRQQQNGGTILVVSAVINIVSWILHNYR
mmetsp:Transcript_23710/g.50426  ORF Transcript_23710/g.50426 Transcript_23710/m.50426 type:complete len:479 (+) Transcript_23710:136-1572(+)